jgi:hypothetical protein
MVRDSPHASGLQTPAAAVDGARFQSWFAARFALSDHDNLQHMDHFRPCWAGGSGIRYRREYCRLGQDICGDSVGDFDSGRLVRPPAAQKITVVGFAIVLAIAISLAKGAPGRPPSTFRYIFICLVVAAAGSGERTGVAALAFIAIVIILSLPRQVLFQLLSSHQAA